MNLTYAGLKDESALNLWMIGFLSGQQVPDDYPPLQPDLALSQDVVS